MAVVKSEFEDVTWENISFPKKVLQSAEKFLDRDALIQDETGERMTYRQFLQNTRCVGSSLHAKGYRKGDKILIFSPNSIIYPCVFQGACLVGIIVTTCNPLYSTDDLVRQLNDSGAIALITMEVLKDKALAAATKYGKLKELYLFDGKDDNFLSVQELLRGDPEKCPDVDIDSEDIMCMPYSSGTTGFPKGVSVSHRALVATIKQMSLNETNSFANGHHVALGVVPFYHILGMGFFMGLAFTEGVTTIVQSRFVPEKFIQAIEKYKVTNMTIVPPIAVMLAKHPAMENMDTSSLKFITCAAAPLAVSVIRDLQKKLPQVNIIQLYGMTETLVITSCLCNSNNNPPGSVGKVISNTIMKIVDTETGELCGPNKPGEIWVKGPGLMINYHGNKAATEDFFSEDGYAKTGDIGYVNEDGYLFVIDRLKELIKYNAHQVAPAELESLLLSHPSIADAAVIGIPDENAGELPKAFVVKKPGCQALTEEQVAQYIAGHVAPQKKLRGGVEFRSAIPKLPSGKILRRVLRAEAAEARSTSEKINS